MRLLSWNVNGLRAVEKKGFLDWFKGTGPDILCIQETKLQEHQIPPTLRSVEGFHTFFESGERKGYSGVAVYSKREPGVVSTGFGSEELDNEGRILIADYSDFVLFNIYFPNGRSSTERLEYKMKFYHAFLDFVDGMKQSGRNIVICGDLNTAHKEIDLARPKANETTSGFLPQERAWMDELVDHGYVDTFRMFNQEPEHYSYWDMMSRARERNVGWRIDYFFVSEGFKDHVKSAFILPEVMGSDHCPVGIDIG